jgi:hypothetical protein
MARPSPSVVRPVDCGLAERHASRTCLASGYDAVLVLKIYRMGPVAHAKEIVESYDTAVTLRQVSYWSRTRMLPNTD